MVLIWRIDLWIQAFQSYTPADTNTTLFNLPAVTFLWLSAASSWCSFVFLVRKLVWKSSLLLLHAEKLQGWENTVPLHMMYCNVITIWPSVKCLGGFFPLLTNFNMWHVLTLGLQLPGCYLNQTAPGCLTPFTGSTSIQTQITSELLRPHSESTNWCVLSLY